MSASRIIIDRLSISLHGVSETVAEQAAASLERELRTRLAAGPYTARSDLVEDIASLRLTAMDVSATTDGAELAGIIAGRLTDWLGGPNAERED